MLSLLNIFRFVFSLGFSVYSFALHLLRLGAPFQEINSFLSPSLSLYISKYSLLRVWNKNLFP
jgi:hypothetical protein